jgi:hypothetical protein
MVLLVQAKNGLRHKTRKLAQSHHFDQGVSDITSR